METNIDEFKTLVETGIDDLVLTAQRTKALSGTIVAAGELIRERVWAGSKVLTAGNGGSAADALHLAEELVGRYCKERRSLGAICLSADPTLLTCISNDYGFENLFSRQIEGLGKAGDVFVVFSTSGNSANLIRGLEAAKSLGIATVSVLGKNGGSAKGLADIEIIVPSNTTARVQEIHTFILHSWLEIVESKI